MGSFFGTPKFFDPLTKRCAGDPKIWPPEIRFVGWSENLPFSSKVREKFWKLYNFLQNFPKNLEICFFTHEILLNFMNRRTIVQIIDKKVRWYQILLIFWSILHVFRNLFFVRYPPKFGALGTPREGKLLGSRGKLGGRAFYPLTWPSTLYTIYVVDDYYTIKFYR